MKKIFLTMSLAAAAMNINAQLVVDSLGRVGVGTVHLFSVLLDLFHRLYHGELCEDHDLSGGG